MNTLEIVIKQVEKWGDNWVIPIALLFAILFNLKAIYDFWNIVSRRKLSMFKYLLEENGATGKVKGILQEQINSVAISYAIGIKADQYLQERVIDLYKISNGRLTYADLKKTLSFLEIGKCGYIEIRRFTTSGKFTFADRLIICITYILLALFALAGFLSLSLYAVLPRDELSIRLIMFLFSLFFFLTVFFVRATMPLFADLEKVNKEILRNRVRLMKYSSFVDEPRESRQSGLTEFAKSRENFD